MPDSGATSQISRQKTFHGWPIPSISKVSGGGNPRTNSARQNVSREIGDNLPKANVVRGLVPRWGRGGEWQNPTREFAEPTHDSGFSYLGVPAPAGMSDWYENDVTGLQLRL